jgi:hypothetical protein
MHCEDTQPGNSQQSVSADTGPGKPFHSEREEFMFKALAFGHLNLHFGEDVEFISREEFKSVFREQRAERWMIELLEADKEVTFARLPVEGPPNPFQRLFFSDLVVFGHYVKTQSLPLLNMEQHAQLALITRLPDNLLSFEPEQFWEKWVF